MPPSMFRAAHFVMLVTVLLAAGKAVAQRTLSPEATISVLTFGPWQGELYSAFGHSAIRAHDPIGDIDIAFNYGVFDFNQPHFYLNFARGYLYYKVDAFDYPSFRDYYIRHNRFVHEQILNLSPEQKQKVFDFLVWNIQPANQTYRYDYYYNNCATKIHDVIKSVLKDSVTFDPSYIKTTYSLRQLTGQYLKYQPWGDLGIDICLGYPIDPIARPEEYRFLPDFIESSFDHATVQIGGAALPLVKKKVLVFESHEEAPPQGLPHPLLVFSLVFALTLTFSYVDLKRGKTRTWFDALLFGATGGIGLLLFFLWAFTDHRASAMNFNLLWAWPTHLVAVVAFIKQPRWLKPYFLFTTIASALLLAAWLFLPQELNPALTPIVLAIGTRAYIQYKVRYKNNVMATE